MYTTRKDYIDLIRQLQGEVFHKIKKCWGFHIWPIVQIQVGYYLHLIYAGKIKITERQPTRKSNFDGKIKISDFIFFLKAVYWLFSLYPKWKGKLKDKTLLSGFKTHNVGDFNQYVDTYKEILDENNENSEIFYVDDIFSNKQNEFYNLCRHLYTVILFLLKIKNKIFGYQIKNVKYNTNLVESFFAQSTSLDSHYIASLTYNSIIENYFYYNYFKCLLKITSPRRIWCYVYYDNRYSALIRAANSLKISSCEYQHSTISNDHFAYTRWCKIDKYAEGFPSCFNVWSKKDKEVICHNFSGHIYHPQVIVSGNYYLSRQKDKLQNESRKNKDSILICLQGTWIPQFIEEVIAESESKKWYIRLHPRYPHDKPQLLSLYEKYPDRIEIEHSNQLPLYDLFNEVSTLLVSFSGTAIEAKEFGLRVIIFGSEGYNTYRDFIENDDFSYVDGKKALLKLIK